MNEIEVSSTQILIPKAGIKIVGQEEVIIDIIVTMIERNTGYLHD